MGKVELNKKQKKNALLQTAFELFTDKGFAKTTIADIASHSGLAKGTFYLYFKDKYDLRNKLIAYKASQLFGDAHQKLMEESISGFENQLLFVVDHIINKLEQDSGLLQFITKNLSWGIFKTAFETPLPDESQEFYSYYLELMQKDSLSCKEPELMLFTIIELVGSTCYSCILYHQPVSMEEYLPHLHETIHQIMQLYTIPI